MYASAPVIERSEDIARSPTIPDQAIPVIVVQYGGEKVMIERIFEYKVRILLLWRGRVRERVTHGSAL